MHWEKKGHIFVPDASIPWMVTHAQVPTVFIIENCIRVFFSTRNQEGKSQIGIIDLARDNPRKIIKLYDTPALSFGKPGTFDDDGVMPSHVEKVNDELWMFYSGWNKREHVPYHNSMGVAISKDNGITFERISDGPIMDRTFEEPYIAVTPTILRENKIWRMCYISGIRWKKIGPKFEPVYVIKYAESTDGIHWLRNSQILIKQKDSLEAFSRPCLLKQKQNYYLWYCYRGSEDFRDGKNSYRLGFASSNDCIEWSRRDNEVGITLSSQGWDSSMICYPNIIDNHGKLMLFYNGNGFGKSGFGYAVLEGNIES